MVPQHHGVVSFPVLAIPELVRNEAQLVGAHGWLEGLPGLIADLEEEWEISVGAPYADATEAYVARATRSDGTPAVLKLTVPRDQEAPLREITALRQAGGRGCAALICSDGRRGALLVERLGRSLFELSLPITRRHEILCDTAETLWRPAPDCGLPSGAEKAAWLQQSIVRTWEELDRPCSAEAIDDAVACAERRMAAHLDERAVLVHGDVHQWNTLEAGTGFKLVDPDGLLAEPEYDLGIIIREDPEELLVGDPRAGPLAGPPLAPRRAGHLGMGRGGEGLDRPSRTPGRLRSAGAPDARRGRADRRP